MENLFSTLIYIENFGNYVPHFQQRRGRFRGFPVRGCAAGRPLVQAEFWDAGEGGAGRGLAILGEPVAPAEGKEGVSGQGVLTGKGGNALRARPGPSACGRRSGPTAGPRITGSPANRRPLLVPSHTAHASKKLQEGGATGRRT